MNKDFKDPTLTFMIDDALSRGTQREYSSKPLNIALLNLF